MKKYFILYLLTTLAFTCFAKEKTKMIRQGNAEVELFNNDWKFYRYGLQADGNRIEEPQNLSGTDLNDSNWRKLTLPHDFGIEGPFRMDLAGNTGRLPFQGIGWYRKSFKLSKEDAGKQIYIDFDGVMAYAEVWLNEQYIGGWPYGYNSFRLDLTPFIKSDAENVLAVRTNTEKWDSRWYPGAGIYRNVWLVKTGKTHVAHWGTFITTTDITDQSAQINLEIEIENNQETAVKAKVVTDIFEINANDLFGKKVLSFENEDIQLVAHTSGKISQSKKITNYKKWDIESPNRYVAQTRIIVDGKTDDCYYTPFGIRTIEFSRNGFFLNGRKIEIKGVCNHHDLGPLGAAVNDAAIRRQIRILKDMGCNAIRTSHNMPAPDLVKACDEMGMMLMAESFDEWNVAKCKNGYNLFFDEWAEKDMVNLLHNFRNNPSIVMWCIGNEVPNQWIEGDAKIARFLQDICHREDPTRPVTQGMDAPDAVVNNNFAAVMEVAGFNYRPFKYQINYKKLPQEIILGSETASTVSSRGVYKFPVERKAMAVYDDHQSSSYDVEHCGWSNLPEDDFIQHEDLPYCIGEFVWTGFDYLGEPTPYYTNWPSHSSLFGIIDLAGIPKDRYYLYRSHWNKAEKTLHILPHWTWPGREGEVTPVFVYTNYPSAELFINGKSQGKRTKDLSIGIDSSYTEAAQKSFERQKRYRLMWMDTKYEPGTLKVVAYDKDGNAVAEEEVHTAGKPHHIELSADRTNLTADGKDLSFINVRVVDKNGNLCPDATNQIKFNVRGNGTYKAAANGNPASLESFQAPQMKLFSGQLTAIVQTEETPGTIYFEASSPGVKSARIELISR